MRVAGALLAAGGSSRFGQPKAFLKVGGTTLLRRLATELAAVTSPALAVVPPPPGPYALELDGTGARVIINRRPERGMGSSLAMAARALAAFTRDSDYPDALLVALVDQPLADRALFAQLIAAAAAGDGWAAASWSDPETGEEIFGSPALFPRSAFTDLMELDGDRGARTLLRQAGLRVARVPFAGGACDIDTPADYERLLQTLGEAPPGVERR